MSLTVWRSYFCDAAILKKVLLYCHVDSFCIKMETFHQQLKQFLTVQDEYSYSVTTLVGWFLKCLEQHDLCYNFPSL